MSRYDLADFEWRVIEPLLPNKPQCGRNRCVVAPGRRTVSPVPPQIDTPPRAMQFPAADRWATGSATQE